MSETPRTKVDVEQLEHELRKLHDLKAAKAEDPLAALARIVQQDDPFAIAYGRKPTTAQPSAPAAPARPAQSAAVDPRVADFRAMLEQRAPRAAPAQPATAPVAPADAYSNAPPADPAPRQATAYGAATRSAAPARDDLGAMLEELEPRDIRLPPRRTERVEAEDRRSSPLVRVAAPLVAMLVIGGGAYYAYSNFRTGPAAPKTATAPLIKAPETPAKVAPPAQKPADEIVQASKVLEPKAEDPKAPQSVVSTVEQPVDLKETTPKKETPRVIPLEKGQGAPLVVLPDPKPLPKPAPAPAAVPAVAPAKPSVAAVEVPVPAKPAAPVVPVPPAATEAAKPQPAAPAVAAVPQTEPTPAPVAEAPKPVAPAAEPPATAPAPTVETVIAAAPPTATPPQPVVEAPAVPPVEAPVVQSAPVVPVSRATRMKAVEPPPSLVSIAVEELPGPGIADKPRRVKSVKVAVPDPSLTRSVRSAAPSTNPVMTVAVEQDAPAPIPQEAPAPAAAELAAAQPPPDTNAAIRPEATPDPAKAAAVDAPVPAAPSAEEKTAEAAPAASVPEETPQPAKRAQRKTLEQNAATGKEQTRRQASNAASAKARKSDGPISLDPEAAPRPRTVVASNASQGSGGFAVQFAAPTTEGDANAEVARIRSRFGGALGGASPRIVRATVNGRVVYRVRAAGLSRDGANQLCAQVKASGGNCFVSNTN